MVSRRAASLDPPELSILPDRKRHSPGHGLEQAIDPAGHIVRPIITDLVGRWVNRDHVHEGFGRHDLPEGAAVIVNRFDVKRQ